MFKCLSIAHTVNDRISPQFRIAPLSIKPPRGKIIFAKISPISNKPPGGLFRFFTIITVLHFLRLKSKYNSIICILLDIPCYYATIYKLCNNISFKIRTLIHFSKNFVHPYTVKSRRLGLISKALFG